MFEKIFGFISRIANAVGAMSTGRKVRFGGALLMLLSALGIIKQSVATPLLPEVTDDIAAAVEEATEPADISE